MSARRFLQATAAALLAVALLAAPALASHRRYSFLAGAGRADTTPPLSGSAAAKSADAQFAPRFSDCPSAVFGDRGTFALQEPFSDVTHDPSSGPFCDVDANGRWDGVYADNGRGPLTGIHDPLEVRAVAISDGVHRPVVYASVEAIGLFDYYTELARSDLLHEYGVRADLVVSADHNESSPDTIGLYGGLQTPAGVGVRSGIDEYYMDFLADRIARAAAGAVRSMRPATLYANQVSSPVARGASGSRYGLLSGLSQRISDQFPTSVALPGDDRIAAVDPKLGVLQARAPGGRTIFTVVSIAAHNQEMGNSGSELSGDWPGAMVRALDARGAGTSMFLVGDNGSEEDPQTEPPVIPNGSENHSNPQTQFLQARATGARFANVAAKAAAAAVRLAPGPVVLTRRQLCVPLENNGFLALAAAGDFGRRQAYVCDAAGHPVAPLPNAAVLPTSGTQFRTFVSYADIGPDVQLIDNPGEAFPALMLGSPFGVEDESCNRPNPPVPTWHARAVFRFQVGLADDLIGYLIPAWGFASGTPGLFNDDTCSEDMNGHRHKLESESVGPTGANDVASGLAALLDREPDPSARIVTGRYVLPDGSYSRWPTGAVGIAIAGSGRVIGAARTAAFGARSVRDRGLFMDYDGQPQASPDLSTRGVMTIDARGCVARRYYLDVFPDVTGLPRLGQVEKERRGPLPTRACAVLSRHGVPELAPGAAAAAGLRARRS